MTPAHSGARVRLLRGLVLEVVGAQGWKGNVCTAMPFEPPRTVQADAAEALHLDAHASQGRHERTELVIGLDFEEHPEGGVQEVELEKLLGAGGISVLDRLQEMSVDLGEVSQDDRPAEVQTLLSLGVAVLFCVAGAAGPARRASRLDPAAVLAE